MNFWERNLNALKQSNPELATRLSQVGVPEDYRVLASRQGSPYLMVGNRRLHSVYDPVKEGEEWAGAQELETSEALVIFGLGLGYHVLPFLRKEQPVWVVEPSLAVARLALENQDLSPLLARNGLRIAKAFTDLPRSARLLVHTPSRRMAPGVYRRLTAFLAGEQQTPGPLRILVVSPLYGGSHPIARYTNKGFKDLGHEAELLDFAPFYKGHKVLPGITTDQGAANKLAREWMKFLGEILLCRVRDFRPDLVFLMAQSPVDPHLVRSLKAEGPLVAYWFVEDFQVFPYWRELAPEVDVFFTLQQEPFFQELNRLQAEHYAFLPLAAEPEIYRLLTLSNEERRHFGAALSFVGAGYQNRREFFQGFLDYDFKIWGSEWILNSPLGQTIQNRGARVSEEEAVKIFNASRINLNLHSSPFHQGINPQGDYLNPRVFDLAACGAFQVVDWRGQLPEFFHPGEELITFTSLSEAREKIDYFLAHDDERCRIAHMGRERCLKDHTCRLRLAEALSIIEDLHPEILPRRPQPEPPMQALRRQFPSDHPVQALLDRAPEEITDLGGLVEHFQAGDEPLTEPEAMLWLLHEFNQGLKRGRF